MLFRSIGDKALADRAKRELANMDAIEKWKKGNLTNYIKREMATPDDSIRKLAEEGISHNPQLLNLYERQVRNNPDSLVMNQVREKRKNAGFPEEGIGKSQLAQGWEFLADEAITPYRAGDIQAAMNAEPLVKETNTKLNLELEKLNKDFDTWLRSKPDLDEKDIVALNKMQPDDKEIGRAHV